jgi:hypothetical protein
VAGVRAGCRSRRGGASSRPPRPRDEEEPPEAHRPPGGSHRRSHRAGCARPGHQVAPDAGNPRIGVGLDTEAGCIGSLEEASSAEGGNAEARDAEACNQNDGNREGDGVGLRGQAGWNCPRIGVGCVDERHGIHGLDEEAGDEEAGDEGAWDVDAPLRFVELTVG